MTTTGSLQERYNKISQELALFQKNNPGAQQVQLIAVSKKQPLNKIRELYKLGQRDFAENYLQEAQSKMSELGDLDIRWHYIGNIQSKKIPELVGRFEYIHSVGRLKEIKVMEQIALEHNLKQKILLQVNIAEEESKQGFGVNQVIEAFEFGHRCSHLQICGLMVFPPLVDDDQEALRWFKKGHDLFLIGREQVGESFDRLSMGTSHDYLLAMSQGATDIRVGEKLMGPR